MSKRGARLKKLIELSKSHSETLLHKPIYLYLTKKEWTTAWIDGGSIPLSMTSKYLSLERAGTMTPDEDIHRQLDGMPYSEFDKIFDIRGLKFVHISNVTIANGKGGYMPTFRESVEPALVLCFATEKSAFIAKELGKEACVKINDINRLKDVLDRQLGVVSKSGRCEYTSSRNRNHFLKSAEDAWQHEFRFIWEAIKTECLVKLPEGMATLVEL